GGLGQMKTPAAIGGFTSSHVNEVSAVPMAGWLDSSDANVCANRQSQVHGVRVRVPARPQSRRALGRALQGRCFANERAGRLVWSGLFLQAFCHFLPCPGFTYSYEAHSVRGLRLPEPATRRPSRYAPA